MTVSSPRLRVAYVVSQYPKLSHTFIATEVAGLRAAGVEVHTFSVHRPDHNDTLSDANADEAAATTYLLAELPRQIGWCLRLVLAHPVELFRTAWEALKFSRNVRLRRRLAYFLEALVLARMLHDRRLVHVHVHLANNAADVAHLATVLGARAFNCTWTWSLAVHGPNELNDVSRYNLAGKVASAAFVACITDYCRSQLMAITPPEAWSRLHVVRMGIDSHRYVPDLNEPGQDDQPTRVLFVGRLVPEKAPALLVSAFAQLPRDKFLLRLVGGGELEHSLAEQVAELGLSDSVTLTGPIGQDDLPAHYAWADVFCLPSFTEGLPIVLMEAMACGLAVVATRIAGIPELVTDGVNGRLLTPGDGGDIVRVLQDLAVPGERRRLSSDARQLVVERYDASTNALALIPLFAHELGVPLADGAR